MMQKSSERMMAPDILKIAAAIFVVVIHHKTNSSARFAAQYHLFQIILLVICVALGIYLFVKEYTRGNSFAESIKKFALPLLAWIGFVCLKKFPVAIFLVLSSYFMTGSLTKSQRPVKDWYTFENIIPRIARFYIPFSPLFVIGLIYKIFVLKYDYTVAEVIARFFLGGFKPGSYYITILAELVLIFPLIYAVVVKFQFSGVILCSAFTLLYDVFFECFGWNDVAYKFIVFRFTAHIAFGVYGKITDFKWKSPQSLFSFIFGLLYVVCCVWTSAYKPPIFFQWQEASFPTAFFIYPVIAWFVTVFKDAVYRKSLPSRAVATVAGATYHVFLVQLLYYTTFGFALNEHINNFLISMPLNLTVTFIFGVAYYRLFSSIENAFVLKLKLLCSKSTKH